MSKLFRVYICIGLMIAILALAWVNFSPSKTMDANINAEFCFFDAMTWGSVSPDGNFGVTLAAAPTVQRDVAIALNGAEGSFRKWLLANERIYSDDIGPTRTIIVTDENLKPAYCIQWNMKTHTAAIQEAIPIAEGNEGGAVVNPKYLGFGDLSTSAVKVLSKIHQKYDITFD